MKKTLIIYLYFIFVISINAQQLKDVYVLSEGGFSAGTSMLSKLNITSQIFTQDIFSPGNIGLYPDGMIIKNDKVYIVEQGSFGGAGKIYKLDTNGTVINSKEVGTNPYSITIANGKIYITNGPASRVSVLNENDFSKVKDLTVGVYPQEIISYNNKVFVANNGIWGGASDSTITVIDSETDEVIHNIKVKLNPSSLAITNDGKLLVGCPSGIIYKVDLTTFEKVDSFLVTDSGFGNDIYVDKSSDMIYFKSGSNKIIGLNLNAGEPKTVVDDPNIIFAYGYSYDYIAGKHYLTDAKDFSSNGTLNVYNNDGELLNSYNTGIAPRRVALNYDENTVSINNELISSDFKLDQNYPNPFNPNTIIEFSIPSNANRETSNVKLIVYDILGNEVSVLVDARKSSGNYSIKFDAGNLSSGIYIYKLQSGNFISTRRMMLIK
ncbi:MAG: T9SS type A sorting domain-containing protein [Ignavibacteriae bacterium]|nr:T9SS type A sorting domain-containing protein [Ignavibacteriota bacterium]